MLCRRSHVQTQPQQSSALLNVLSMELMGNNNSSTGFILYVSHRLVDPTTPDPMTRRTRCTTNTVIPLLQHTNKLIPCGCLESSVNLHQSDSTPGWHGWMGWRNVVFCTLWPAEMLYNHWFIPNIEHIRRYYNSIYNVNVIAFGVFIVIPSSIGSKCHHNWFGTFIFPHPIATCAAFITHDIAQCVIGLWGGWLTIEIETGNNVPCPEWVQCKLINSVRGA